MNSSKRMWLVAMSVGLAGVLSAPGNVFIQELFDDMAPDVTLDGQGDNASSIGFAPAGTWSVNAGGTIFSANNFNVESSPVLPGLPPLDTVNGGLWKGGGNDWATDRWATRALDAGAGIDFSQDGEYFFSFRLNNAGDTAIGMGFADGSTPASGFLGIGAHWNGATDVFGQNTANALYLSTGTLDQNLGGNNQGPYASLSHAAADTLNGRALIVGRLTLNAVGNDLIDLKQYDPGSTIENDLDAVSWTISDNFDSSLNSSHLLVWLNGAGNGELDAIRIGTSWADVTGVALIPEPGTAALLALSLLALIGYKRSAGRS